MQKISNRVTKQLGIEFPIFCGAMYPCSNPELVASVSEAGGIGIVQPLSMVYVHGYEIKEGLKKIRHLTKKPFGFNVLVEKNSKIYENRMQQWVEAALSEGCRFFVTALGNPKWLVDKVKPLGGIVYHDVTELKWAKKVIDLGIDGFICVNNRAGGHAGTFNAKELYEQLSILNLPLVCAGGIGDENDFREALKTGYEAVQIGTRFIATTECNSHEDYKKAILSSSEKDIVLTERVTGIPLSVIRTPYVEKIGLKVDPLSKLLFKHPKTRQWIRLFYNIRAVRAMKRSALKGLSTKDYYQAGRGVSHIHKVEPVKSIIDRFVNNI